MVNTAGFEFHPEFAEYTPDNGFYSTYVMMYLYSILSLILTVIFFYYGYFRPNRLFLNCTNYDFENNFNLIVTRKYNNAGWHFLFLFITWFFWAIRHHFNKDSYSNTHSVVNIISSIFYHLSILFYLLSIGPPPDYIKLNKLEWILFVMFSLCLVIISFIVDLILKQTMFCYILWFCSNIYLFIYTLIDIWINGCNKTPFYFHSSVLFTIFAAIVTFVPFHFFKGFESTEIVNNYVLIIISFMISTLFYFGALMLESKEKQNKQQSNERYRGRGNHQSMISFENEYNEDLGDEYEEVALMNVNYQD